MNSENTFRTLLDTISDSVLVIDTDGHFIHVNRAACDQLGYSHEELLRLGPAAISTPENAAKIQERIKAAFDRGELFLESAHIRKDGGEIPVEMNCKVIAFDDKPAVLCVARDITERKRMEKELVAREQESRTMLENTPDTIARYGRDCRRIYANPAFGALVSGGVAELLGKKPSESPGGKNADTYEAKVKEVFTTGENAQFELKWPNKDGKEICSHIRLTPERDAQGNIVSVLGVGRDITDVNEYRVALIRKEEAKTRFLAAAGHDLRQPLAAANLFIEALKFTQTTAAQDEIIRRLGQTMSSFNDLLNALLDISKLDAGMIEPEFTAIHIEEMMDWLEKSFARITSDKQLVLKLHYPVRESLDVRGDIGLLKSVLMNLVSNAIKFTAHGAILVSARRRGPDILFQVWDTGMGIPEESIGQIFDEFYQANNPQRDRTRGLGLGLTIAKRTISLLGGEITCRSRVGHGSVFGFRLPLNAASGGVREQSVAAVSGTDEVNNTFVCGKRFIVVEDDLLVNEALSKSLLAMGGEVECFYSAEDALSHPHIEDNDYFIVDHMLGGAQNGIQFLNQLRNRLGKPIQAVLMTGDTSQSFIHKARSFDWPVLYKPASMAVIISGLSSNKQ